MSSDLEGAVREASSRPVRPLHHAAVRLARVAIPRPSHNGDLVRREQECRLLEALSVIACERSVPGGLIADLLDLTTLSVNQLESTYKKVRAADDFTAIRLKNTFDLPNYEVATRLSAVHLHLERFAETLSDVSALLESPLLDLDGRGLRRPVSAAQCGQLLIAASPEHVQIEAHDAISGQRFTLSNTAVNTLNAGRYDVTFSAASCIPLTISVALKAGQAVPLSATLEAERTDL